MSQPERLTQIKSFLERIGTTDAIGADISQGTITSLLANFSSLEQELRKYIQQITRGEIISIVDKLRRKDSLSREELSCIELWIVGDAEYYTKLKLNFGQWLRDSNRILDDVKGYQGCAFDLEACSMLRVILKDGIRNLSDIDYFIQEEERVERFRKSIQKLDDESRGMLIEILEGKINLDDS